ncbi:hypothetical protein [Luteolibacter sp. Populi]|uniref:hypothetical protein n=1 Tax=Luteolibacter sp. Populi TaxID=3230487 RepID=UPI0034652584
MKTDEAESNGTEVPVEEEMQPVLRTESGFIRFWRKLGGGSLMVAILLHVIILVLGAFWVIKTLREPEKTVDFIPGKGGGGGGAGELQKQAKSVKLPMNQSVKRVTVEGVSEVVMPDPGDSFGQMASMSSLSGGGGLGGGSGFGRGGGNGNGIGPGSGNGMGAGGFGTGTVFFNQEIKAARVAYVIDYSLSMRGKREDLMRKELEKSVRKLNPLMRYQLIFFCGPAWIAGDELVVGLGNRDAIVKHQGKEYEWKTPGGGRWEPSGKKVKVEWLNADPAIVEQSASHIKKTPLASGTHWVAPLEMALEMDPPPEVILFMTDGASPGTTEKDIERLASRARGRKTIINTMSLMEPDADEGMKMLARLAKGTFTVIDETGTAREVPLDK